MKKPLSIQDLKGKKQYHDAGGCCGLLKTDNGVGGF